MRRWTTRRATALPAVALSVVAGCGSDGSSVAGGTGSGPAFGSCDPPPVLDGAVLVDAEPSLIATREEMPGIAEQPTPRGRVIVALHGHGERLYIGYGDWADNTGPIAVLSYDPERGTFDASESLPTEEVSGFWLHGESLFVPDIDPVGHEALGGVFRLDADQGWGSMTPIDGAVHVFALASFDGRLFATTGSLSDAPAFVVSTDDGGESWIEEHSTRADGGHTRYRHVAATATQLVAAGRTYGPAGAPFAHALDADGWRELGGVPSGDGPLIPVAVGTELALLKLDREPGRGGRHRGSYVIDGDTLVEACVLPAGYEVVAWSVERSVEGSRLVAIASDAEGRAWLLRADEPSRWSTVARLPELIDDAFTAVAAYDRVYLGTRRGDLYGLPGA